MTPDEESWSEALAVERQCGEAAAAHIAQLITALALAGDNAGVARGIEIAVRLDALDQRPERPV
ncbi:MAG TPA: hypothetical protein DEP91_05895 [Sphingomonas bacterium]|jgi:hypothetical protein|uniref:Uncharacterized protein n=1 Tax=Sphingomonas bacterium TaxID=1895847 RepID=A0A3D0WCJ2_9SPHN|nr:hypothetical protein [Sphingomonas bacterium]